MLEPSQLPAGIHVETHHDEGTVDLFNASDRIVEMSAGEAMQAVGACDTCADERKIILYPGERHTLIAGNRLNCTVISRQPRLFGGRG